MEPSVAKINATPQKRKHSRSTNTSESTVSGSNNRQPSLNTRSMVRALDGPQTEKRKKACEEKQLHCDPSPEQMTEYANDTHLLHQLVSNDNHELLKNTLKMIPPSKRFQSLKVQNQDWLTPLQMAAKESKSACVKVILSSVKLAEGMELMAQPDSETFMRSALYLACENNSLECIKEILNFVPRIAKRLIFMFLREQEIFYGWTPLHAAVRCGSPEAVKFLVDAVNPEDAAKLITLASFYDGRTPLHVAAQFNEDEETLECLLGLLNPVQRLQALSKECSMDIAAHPEKKRNVLQTVVENWKKDGPAKLAVLLEAIGPDISTLLKETVVAESSISISNFPSGGPAFVQILKSRPDEEKKSLLKLLGKTPLKWAARTYDKKVFSYILNRLYPTKVFGMFSVVNMVDRIKQMDRHYLDMMAEVYDVIKEAHKKDILEKLISRFPKQLLDMPQGARKNTPLHVACEAGNRYAVQFLINKGVRVDLPDHSGRTPLLIALRSHNCCIVDDLTDAGAIGNLSYRRVALVRAVKICCMSCIRQIYKSTAQHLSSNELSYDLGRQLSESYSRTTFPISKGLLIYLLKECTEPNLFFYSNSFNFMPILRTLRQKIKKKFDFPHKQELPILRTICNLIMDIGVQLDNVTKRELPKFLVHHTRLNNPEFVKLSKVVAHYFDTSCKQPHSLQHLARQIIRARLRTGRISEGVKALNISTNMKDYIALSYADQFIEANARDYSLPTSYYRSDNDFDSSGSEDW